MLTEMRCAKKNTASLSSQDTLTQMECGGQLSAVRNSMTEMPRAPRFSTAIIIIIIIIIEVSKS